MAKGSPQYARRGQTGKVGHALATHVGTGLHVDEVAVACTDEAKGTRHMHERQLVGPGSILEPSTKRRKKYEDKFVISTLWFMYSSQLMVLMHVSRIALTDKETLKTNAAAYDTKDSKPAPRLEKKVYDVSGT